MFSFRTTPLDRQEDLVLRRGSLAVLCNQSAWDPERQEYLFESLYRNGRLRQLHTAEAAEVIDYEVAEDYHTAYLPARNEPVGLISCQYFRTALYDLDEPMALDYSELDSFVVLIGLKGEGVLALDDGSRATLNAGETVLLPATTDFVMVSGKIKFLETYV